MATALYNITGEASWAKLFERNRDRGDFHEATDGITSINILLDKESLDVLKKSGSRLRPSITEDGMSVKFRRPWVHQSVTEFGGQAKIVDKDDEPWDTSIAIGNGSKVEVFFSVYDTSKGKGTRLEGVRVLELVEYESEGGGGVKLPF